MSPKLANSLSTEAELAGNLFTRTMRGRKLGGKSLLLMFFRHIVTGVTLAAKGEV